MALVIHLIVASARLRTPRRSEEAMAGPPNQYGGRAVRLTL